MQPMMLDEYDHLNNGTLGSDYSAGVAVSKGGVVIHLSVDEVARAILAGNRTLLRVLSRIISDRSLRPDYLSDERILRMIEPAIEVLKEKVYAE